MNEESTNQLLREILREMREQSSRTEATSLFLNQLNTEVARMTVELKHVADQQKFLQDHDKRIAVLEANAAQHEKFEAKLADQNRWIVGLGVTLLAVVVSVVGIFAQQFGKH